MNKIFFILLLVYFPNSYAQNKKIKYERRKVNEWDNSVSVDNSTETILDYRPLNNSLYPAWRPARVHVVCTQIVNNTYPLFVTASQQSVTQSWQIPMKMEVYDENKDYNYFSRTLCPTNSDSSINWPLVHLTTENPTDVNVRVKVEMVDKYEVPLANKSEPEDSWLSTELRVNEPEFYSFHFSPKNKTIRNVTIGDMLPKIESPQTVILMLESENTDCMIVSIQNLSCPVYDNEETIRDKGDFFTMMDKGGITISQAEFPEGFYIVLYLKTSDEECGGPPKTELLCPADKSCRVKKVRFRVIETISYEHYVIAVFSVLGMILAYLTLMGVISAMINVYVRRTTTVVIENPVSTISPLVDNVIHEEDEAHAETSNLLEGRPRTVSLADLCRLQDCARKSRSDKYLWGIVVISVFYSLPVVQLVVTYQQMALHTGDRDLCYYNFLCAHPLGSLGDANHVFTNVGYLMLGTLFLLIVRRRERRYLANRDLQRFGIPQHFGLYYAMGVSLLVEGILSGTYHICPNKMNFQFDSSFMYVMSVLIMVKLYQSRHPDINAKAHATFAVLACIIFMGFSEILFTYSDINTYTSYWLVLCHVKLLFAIWLSCYIYYMGDWSITYAASGVRSFYRQCRTSTLDVRPANVQLLAVICFLNVANFAFDIYGFERARKRARDLPVHLLQVLLLNSSLYIIIYIAMKVKHREKVNAKAILSLVISNALWAVSLYFFINGRTKWAWTPAHSRSRNAPCTVLDAFDTHDIWHLTSAAALFHTFLLLLTIDDDLAYTPRDKIAIF